MFIFLNLKERVKKYWPLELSVLLFLFSFGLGLFVGQFRVVKNQIAVSQGENIITKLENINRSANHSQSVDFEQFWEVWDSVKEKYVKQPVSDSEMFYGAVEGMVASLGDPYSMYMPPQPAAEFVKDLSGELEGIGAEIGIKNSMLTVISPLPDSPAEKAGLRPGDIILLIDDKDTAGKDTTWAIGNIRGPADTKVILTISREGITKAWPVTITRAKINVPAVLMTIKSGGIAYLRLMQFNENTVGEFNKNIKRMKERGVNKMILDLRGNPGGFLDAAVDVASEWIADGVIVSEKFSDGSIEEYKSNGNGRLADVKTVILVNGGSASASEIVAGALQDYKKAELVGEKTFGKGSVQDFETFSDGSALKITVAEWLTPNGKNINEQGIAPNVEIKEDWENTKVGEDSILDKAIEMLK
ncbi:MAG: S41 family peptidase [Patescibacteria group bacterium]